MNKYIVRAFCRKLKFEDHYPVFWRNILNIIETEVYNKSIPKAYGDFTLGCGNHTKLILDTFDNSYVIGCEIDDKMTEYTSNKLNDYIENDRLVIVEDNYVCVEELKVSELLGNANVFPEKKKFDFMLVDLGFNSLQLLDNTKGISFKDPEALLDMRYDTYNNGKAKASDILNNSSELELMEIFSKYGNETNHEAIAKKCLKYREDRRFETVADFIKVIDDTYDYSKDNSRFNIYTRLFQALRICVNYELTNIQRFLNKAFFNLENEGVLCIISFHSSEDMIVKHFFKELEKMKLGKLVLKKGEKPSREEIEENSRSKSAILRAIKYCPNKKK
jgi:16S rRNA (cytosine1402-N4)-methyltransferase